MEGVDTSPLFASLNSSLAARFSSLYSCRAERLSALYSLRADLLAIRRLMYGSVSSPMRELSVVTEESLLPVAETPLEDSLVPVLFMLTLLSVAGMVLFCAGKVVVESDGVDWAFAKPAQTSKAELAIMELSLIMATPCR